VSSGAHVVLRSTHISGERPSKAKNCVGFSPARRCGVYVKKRCRLLAPKGQCRTTRWGQSGREERGGKAEMASDGSAPLSSMCPISWPPTLPTKPPQHPTQHPPCILTWMFLNSVARLHLLVITSSSPFLLFSFSPFLLFSFSPFLPFSSCYNRYRKGLDHLRSNYFNDINKIHAILKIENRITSPCLAAPGQPW